MAWNQICRDHCPEIPWLVLFIGLNLKLNLKKSIISHMVLSIFHLCTGRCQNRHYKEEKIPHYSIQYWARTSNVNANPLFSWEIFFIRQGYSLGRTLKSTMLRMQGHDWAGWWVQTRVAGLCSAFGRYTKIATTAAGGCIRLGTLCLSKDANQSAQLTEYKSYGPQINQTKWLIYSLIN